MGYVEDECIENVYENYSQNEANHAYLNSRHKTLPQFSSKEIYHEAELPNVNGNLSKQREKPVNERESPEVLPIIDNFLVLLYEFKKIAYG